MSRSFQLLLAGVLLFLGVACSVEPLDDLSGFPCEADGACADGYTCDRETDVCVTTGDSCAVEGQVSPCTYGAEDCSGAGCRTCEDGRWSECVVDGCTPETEIPCNGIDEDCDGSDREETGTDENCAACGDTCGETDDVATAHCDTTGASPVCVVDTCDPGFLDEDDDHANGCETPCVETNGGVETCDGEDNDCDGVADNLADVQADCGGRYPAVNVLTWACDAGACAAEGCGLNHYDIDTDPSNGCEYACTPDAVPTESCDGADNDCDGLTDNVPDVVADCEEQQTDPVDVTAWICLRGACIITGCAPPAADVDRDPDNGCEAACSDSGAEVCDGIDNDCNGTVDDTFVVGEACGTGECAGGFTECSTDGTTTQCDTDPGGTFDLSVTESCDGLDNDCDGDIDEDYNLGDSCGVGDCAGGVLECTPDGTGNRCDTMPGGTNDQSTVEVCDNADNDCDTQIDNDLTDCVCTGGNPPEVETCDGEDDDCNDAIDDVADIDAACNNQLSDPPDVGSWACTDGACEVATCAPNKTDADGDPANGCEEDCTPDLDPTEICDGRDNDCNGVTDDPFNVGDPCGVGVCAGGAYECTADHLGTQCDTESGGSNDQTFAEICDGLDSDCDTFLQMDEVDEDGDGWMVCEGDCDDSVLTCGAACNPGAAEACDGYDTDCGLDGPAADEVDEDGDGYMVCEGDCEDDPGSGCGSACNPGATEVCDGFDTNCDSAGTPAANEIDDDSDGFIECSGYVEHGASLAGGDCNDVPGECGSDCYPGAATENCDGFDTDCSGSVPADEADVDQDGYVVCTGYVDRGAGLIGEGDCNDAASSCTDDCATDDDGDGVEDCLDLCNDVDGDGYGTSWSSRVVGSDADDVGSCTSDGATACAWGDGLCAGGTDCDDSALTGASCHDTCTDFHRDQDGDTYGDSAVTNAQCAAGNGYVADDTDCDDAGACGVGCNPGETEGTADGNCADGFDNDCNQRADCSEAACLGDCGGCNDTDGDGWTDCGATPDCCDSNASCAADCDLCVPSALTLTDDGTVAGCGTAGINVDLDCRTGAAAQITCTAPTQVFVAREAFESSQGIWSVGDGDGLHTWRDGFPDPACTSPVLQGLTDSIGVNGSGGDYLRLDRDGNRYVQLGTALDASAWENLVIELIVGFRDDPEAGMDLELYYCCGASCNPSSANDGILFGTIYNDNDGGQDNCRFETVALPADADGCANLNIRFQWYENLAADPRVGLDDIQIRGDPLFPITEDGGGAYSTSLATCAPAAANVTCTWDDGVNTPQSDANLVSFHPMPVGWWKLDESATTTTAADSSGNANDGTLDNMNGDEWTTGAVDGALALDGGDDYVYTSDQLTGPQDFTVSAWINTSSASGRKIVGFENVETGEGGGNYDRHLYVGTDGLAYFGCYDGNVDLAISTTRVDDGAWHHVVGVRDDAASTITIYIDGTPEDSTASTAAQGYNGYWRIGSYKLNTWTSGGDGYFPGSIDDVRVYDFALSASQVADMY